MVMQQTRPSRPPGPRGRGVVRLLAGFRRDPLALMTEVADTYGDVTRIDVVGQPVFLVRNPEIAARVLVSNQANYCQASHNLVLGDVLGEGLLTGPEDLWARHRRLLQPLFAARRLGDFADGMTGATAQVLDTWVPGRVDMQTEMGALALNVAGRTLFGTELSTDARRVDAAQSTVLRIVGEVGRSPRSLLLSRLPGLGAERAWKLQFVRRRQVAAATRVLDDVVTGILATHDRGAAAGAETAGLIGRLLEVRDGHVRLTRREVRDELLTFLLAGQETTATTLTWMWHLLGGHPEARDTLVTEIRDVLGGRTPEAADLQRLPWTTAVINETLRLYPPVWAMDRTAIDDDELGGHHVPAGSMVIVSAYLNHRDRRWWPRPDEFDPARFLPGQGADRPRLSYMPFGAGRRICIGAGFATMETVLLTAMIAQRFACAPVAGPPVVAEAGLTLRPRNGLPMEVRPLG